MQQYIGTKIINAQPMTRAHWCSFRGWTLPADENGDDEGYLVKYTDGGKPNHPDFDGYISWSPKEQFDGAYIEITNADGLPAHMQRVAGEAATLYSNLLKLKAFQLTPVFGALPEKERLVLQAQALHMGHYMDALNQRLRDAK